jgi:hypothetical protein
MNALIQLKFTFDNIWTVSGDDDEVNSQENSLSLLGKALTLLHIIGGVMLSALEVFAKIGEVGEEAGN